MKLEFSTDFVAEKIQNVGDKYFSRKWPTLTWRREETFSAFITAIISYSHWDLGGVAVD